MRVCTFSLSRISPWLIGCRRPITTYGHKATTKGGINRYDHAIVYMNNARPKRLSDESKLSKESIQVISKNPRDKLEVDSRVNYGKIYTVEHNVKVLFIGKLAKESERTFMTDFDATWNNKPKISYWWRLLSGPLEYYVAEGNNAWLESDGLRLCCRACRGLYTFGMELPGMVDTYSLNLGRVASR